MLLSQLPIEKFNLNIKREVEFDSLGLLISNIDKRLLTFIDNEKHLQDVLLKSNVMILTTAEISEKLPKNKGVAVCTDPRNVFFELHNLLFDNESYVRKSFKTVIGNNCEISTLAHIDSQGVIIGDNVVLEEFVSIKSGTVIGNNSIIRTGSIIGSSGFEFKRKQNTIFGVQHFGGVILGENVEIKCNTVVDKAIYPWDNTCIGNYTKIDNLVHIGHACKIMESVMIPANSVIGGRVVIENGVWIGIGSAIRNGIHIGKDSRVNMGAVVTKDVPDNGSVTGNFAIDHQDFIRKLKNK